MVHKYLKRIASGSGKASKKHQRPRSTELRSEESCIDRILHSAGCFYCDDSADRPDYSELNDGAAAETGRLFYF